MDGEKEETREELGLRRAVVLVGYETRWIVAKLRAASLALANICFLGRLHGGNRCVAVWVRGEEGGGSSFQVVVTVGSRRAHIFIPTSEFGEGWGDVALVIEGFGFGDGWVRRPTGLQTKVLSSSGPVSLPAQGVAGGVSVVHSSAEEDWFRLLDRALVGKIRDIDGKGLSFAKIFDWVLRWLNFSVKVDVRPLGNQAFLFVLPTRHEAESLFHRRWTIGGCLLELGWWNPLALCASSKSSPPAHRVWVQVVGLSIHLRGLEVYRQIGDQCGGFVAADESSVDLGSVEAGPTAELAVTEADLRLDKSRRDFRSGNRSFPKIMGVKDYHNRFMRETDFLGNRVWSLGQPGSHLGFKGVLQPTSLGHPEAHRDGSQGLGTHKWVKSLASKVLGLMDVMGQQKQDAPLTQPNLCGLASDHTDLLNLSIKRVFASIHTGVGSTDPVCEVGLSAEAARSPVETIGGGFVAASENGTSQLAESALDARHTMSDRVALSVDEHESRLELESSCDVLSGNDTGSHLLLASASGTSQVEAVAMTERHSPAVLQLSCDASWADQGEVFEVGHEIAGPSQVLGNELVVTDLQSLAVLHIDLVTGFKQKQKFGDSEGFSGEDIPSAEAMSQWVLDRISEVSRCLGLSFEGHEEEAMRLFGAVEASWRLGTPSSGVSRSLVTPSKGVAEPTVIMYKYFYDFAKGRNDLGHELFLAWAGWVCVWTALMLFVLAIFNACAIINRFTRIAGELFGMLIAVLFIQEAIKGLVSEFETSKSEDPTLRKNQFQWLYTNGLLGIIFCFGLLYTALRSRTARSWKYGTGWLRDFIADYGVPLMVVAWTALSFSVPSKVPSGVPRRLFSPLPWESASLYHWTVIKTLLCGLIGLPPSNGVIPQSPMHTKSLAVLKRQLIRKKMVESAKESIKQQASNSEIYGNMQAVFIEMDSSPIDTVVQELEDLKVAIMESENKGANANGTFDPVKHIDAYLPVRVNEQRVSNLLQSLLVAISVCAMPLIKMIPTSVLWGYFAYMAIDSLPGNQFWERLLLVFITPRRRYKVLEGVHASFVESVPFRHIMMFTLFQFVYFLVCFGVTWIPIAGILFPVPFFILISIRQYILPKFFHPNHLRELDAAEYEEIVGAPQLSPILSFGCKGKIKRSCFLQAGWIFLILQTRRLGELKHPCERNSWRVTGPTNLRWQTS
ncbi:Boron transporter 4 [Camellia lanceoleosa]|uniref:Boron transporter 4 n=1 Tax=Camellia lanceoleosa TaxID=1840588 RepID=A0ACC0F9W9_9ERIC|nr:Boron transporter 4 [Camellia lanceoleosa]